MKWKGREGIGEGRKRERREGYKGEGEWLRPLLTQYEKVC